MNNDTKTTVGLIIPAIFAVVFFIVIFNQNFLNALFVAVSGLLVWFTYSSIVRAKMPDFTGNIVMLYGAMLSLAFFLNYGLTINMFGGYEAQVEGAVGAVMILFFTILLGSLFNNKSELKPEKLEGSSLENKVIPQEEDVVDYANQPAQARADNEEAYDGYDYDYDYDYDELEDTYDDMEDYYSEYEYDEEYED